jgi:TonB family protein
MERLATGTPWLFALAIGCGLWTAPTPARAVERHPIAAAPGCSLYVYSDDSWSGCVDVLPGSPEDDLLVTAARRATSAMRAWERRFPDDLVPTIVDTTGDAAKPPSSSRRAILAFLQRELRATIRVDSMVVEITFDSLQADRADLGWRVWMARSIEGEDHARQPVMDLMLFRTAWIRSDRWSLTGFSNFEMTYWPPSEAAVSAPFPPRPPRVPAAAAEGDGFDPEDPWRYVATNPDVWKSPCFGTASQAPAVDPIPVTTVKPRYPEFAREARIEGTVRLLVCVGETGRVGSVGIAEGVTGLDEAAAAAAKQWVFKPAKDRNGNPVSALAVIEIVFHL